MIIGNGVAALEAVIAFRKLNSDADVTVISDESEYPFSRPALMYVFMGQVRFTDTLLYDPSRLNELRLNLVNDRVTGVDPKSKVVLLESGASYPYDRLLIATGSRPRLIRFEGETSLFDLQNVCGFYHLADLQKLDHLCGASKTAVIIGGYPR